MDVMKDEGQCRWILRYVKRCGYNVQSAWASLTTTVYIYPGEEALEWNQYLLALGSYRPSEYMYCNLTSNATTFPRTFADLSSPLAQTPKTSTFTRYRVQWHPDLPTPPHTTPLSSPNQRRTP